MKAEEILKLVNSYWKFDEQEPISSYHDKQDLLKELESRLSESVTSEAKLKELVVNSFGEEAGEDEDIMHLYRECLKYAVEEVLESRIDQSSKSEEVIQKGLVEFRYGDNNEYELSDWEKLIIVNFNKWIKSKPDPNTDSNVEEEPCKTCEAAEGKSNTWCLEHGKPA